MPSPGRCQPGSDAHPRRRAFVRLLTNGLPQSHAYDLIYRHALAIDDSGTHLAMGSTTGHLWISQNASDSWTQVAGYLPPVACVRFC